MKKLLLGLGSLAAVVVPVTTVVACGRTEKDIIWDITGADTIQKMAEIFKAKLKQMDDIDSYDKAEFKVVDGKRIFDYKLSQQKETAATNTLFKKFNDELIAFMDVSLKARGYTQGYPNFINNYVSGDSVR